MPDPLVSVIIPSYNHGRYISDAVESVLKQTYRNIELIIVDDGSSDDTREVLKTFSHIDGITIVINDQNRGQSAVIKQGLRRARGRFISFLPSDDWYLPEKTALQVKKFLELPETYGVVYGRGQRYSERTNSVRDIGLPSFEGDVLTELLKFGNFVYPVTPMFRREALTEDLFSEEYQAIGEAIYNIVAIDYKFAFVDAVVGVMRDHESNTGKDPTLRIYNDSLKFWSGFFEREDLPREARQLKRQKISRIHLTRGLSRLVQYRDYRQARQILWRAIQVNKACFANPRWIMGISLCSLPRVISDRFLDRKYGSLVGQST